MRTWFFPISGKSFLTALTCLALTGIAFTPGARAQSVNAVPLPSPAAVSVPANQTAAGFQAAAFPARAPLHVKLVFENPSARWVQVSVLDPEGAVIYKKVYYRMPKYYGTLDFSSLPDGEYSLQISGAGENGEDKQLYRYAFQVRSQNSRSLTASNKNLNGELPAVLVQTP